MQISLNSSEIEIIFKDEREDETFNPEKALENFLNKNLDKFLSPLIPPPLKWEPWQPWKPWESIKWDDWVTPIKWVDYFTKKEVSEIKKTLKDTILSELPKILSEDEINIKFEDILKKISKLPTGGGWAMFLRQLMDVNVGTPIAQQYWLTYNPSRSEFTLSTISANGVWGTITGTLSNQTDLQSALDAKVNKSGDTMTGDLIVPDEAYWAGWNGDLSVPTKNAIYDKIQTITTTPWGSDTQIQFNDWGSFGGDSGFTYNKTTDTASITKTGLWATPTAGLQVINSTAATVWTPSQVSPSFLRKGNGFFSNSSTSFPFEVQDYVSGDTNIVAYWKHIWQYRANSGSWAEFMSFSTAPLGLGFSITPWQSLSNGTPWTTRNMTINNTGTNSWIDWKFSGVAKSYLGADSSGAMKFYAGWGSYFEYYQMAGGSLFSYNYPTAFVHSGNGLFGWSVNAGSQSTPTSTLQSQWSFATKGRRVTSNYTLTTTDSVIYADATTPTCNGTPSASCASWTNQTDCEKWDAHGGCSWFAGSPCSDYNWNQSECEWHSGCTYETASCSVYNGDESTCSGTSGCSWSGNDCSPLDEWTCGSTSGCSTNYSACSWDWMTCTGGTGCDGYFDESTCNAALYFTGCTGAYYTCSGSYYTGTCSGTYGAGCSGTAACAGIDDSTNCGLETGCSWTTSITISLPSVITTPERHYWVYNDNSWSADVVLSPFSGDTIDKTTSYTLGTYKDSVHIHALAESISCDSFNEGACTPSGCTKNYSNCSWDSMEGTCSGNAVCVGIGDEWTCTSTTYFSSCSGSYYSVKNWYLLSRS